MHDVETAPEPVAGHVAAGGDVRGRSDGSAAGYHAQRTLPVSVELWRQFTRRRTRSMLAFLAALPLFLLVAFELGGGGDGGGTETQSLLENATSSGLNFAVFTLFIATNVLLIAMVALFFGDTVAGEASWSSLRYLLAAPVPRARLLRQKAIVATLLTTAGLVLLTVVALVVGVWWYGGGALHAPGGEVVPFPAGVVRLAGAVVYLAVHLMWIAGLALWLSVSTDAPLGAVGGTVVVAIGSQILDEATALGELRRYLPTHHSTAWFDLLGNEVAWAAPAGGIFAGMAYATVFVLLALYRFHRKDITS
ncbi:ABC-2 type transport system permease protein [Halopolyspora algeriensis]|uniref:ABC-2 type transport system permease protein n=1 Tax=Halopolyspora algeriensis TaxID=1500506 RepID=A0A368VKL0_9ACTN|nr:ABC transporter permease subunit [Halopolyspora algeriensis]RCW39531.1 ABC-2 type transport system permease protein [Halopolyspora algeriensis]TQM56156.1 ABC-2 type transport system permease protein [Halopolyspora algeriensis]